MQIVEIKRELLLGSLQKDASYTRKQFADLCFDFGVDLIEADTKELYKINVPANRYDLLCTEGLTRGLRIFDLSCAEEKGIKDLKKSLSKMTLWNPQWMYGTTRDLTPEICSYMQDLKKSLSKMTLWNPQWPVGDNKELLYAIIRYIQQILQEHSTCLTSEELIKLLKVKADMRSLLETLKNDFTIPDLNFTLPGIYEISNTKQWLNVAPEFCNSIQNTVKGTCSTSSHAACMQNMQAHNEDLFEFKDMKSTCNLSLQLILIQILISCMIALIGHMEDVFEYILNSIILFITVILSSLTSFPIFFICLIIYVTCIATVNANETQHNRNDDTESASQFAVILIIYVIFIEIYTICVCIIIGRSCHTNINTQSYIECEERETETESDSSNQSSEIDFAHEHGDSEEHFGPDEVLFA